MRFVVVVILAFACSVALASQPGEPLDCADFEFTDASYSCVNFARPCPDSATCPIGGDDRVADNSGAIVYLRNTRLSGCNCDRWRIEIHRFDGVTDNTIGFLDERCFGQLTQKFHDQADPSQPAHPGLVFDRVNGRLLIRFVSYNANAACAITAPPENVLWIAAIQGFTPQFDVLQTFTPQSSAISFRVPDWPEGMAGADHFDTYWGNLTKPIDFAMAHPLACDYPAIPPHVGDYLSVADTVPTPTPGHGVYYITSATYQGATRYGRTTTAGHLSGRDPALLPACAP